VCRASDVSVRVSVKKQILVAGEHFRKMEEHEGT